MLGVELNANGLGAVTLGTTAVYFELAGPTLFCRAVVYRFERPAAPAVLEKLRRGPKEPNARLEYVEASRTLCLTREYVEPVSATGFQTQLGLLVGAALRWSTEEIERLF